MTIHVLNLKYVCNGNKNCCDSEIKCKFFYSFNIAVNAVLRQGVNLISFNQTDLNDQEN